MPSRPFHRFPSGVLDGRIGSPFPFSAPATGGRLVVGRLVEVRRVDSGTAVVLRIEWDPTAEEPEFPLIEAEIAGRLDLAEVARLDLPPEGLGDQLCRETVRQMQIVDRYLGDTSEAAHTFRVERYGTIQGLRIALCLLMGWNPREDADKEGRADDYVKDWHNRNCPDEGPW